MKSVRENFGRFFDTNMMDCHAKFTPPSAGHGMTLNHKMATTRCYFGILVQDDAGAGEDGFEFFNQISISSNG